MNFMNINGFYFLPNLAHYAKAILRSIWTSYEPCSYFPSTKFSFYDTRRCFHLQPTRTLNFRPNGIGLTEVGKKEGGKSCQQGCLQQWVGDNANPLRRRDTWLVSFYNFQHPFTNGTCGVARTFAHYHTKWKAGNEPLSSRYGWFTRL